jgi:hypothetical protein
MSPSVILSRVKLIMKRLGVDPPQDHRIRAEIDVDQRFLCIQSLMESAGFVEIEGLHGPGDDVGWCSSDIDNDTVFIWGQWFEGVQLGGEEARGHEVIGTGADPAGEELGTAAQVQEPDSGLGGP